MLGVEPCTVDIKRIADAGIIDQIRIFLFDAGADGVEVLVHLHRVCHDDILRQVRVERIRDAVTRNAGGSAEIGDIDACVNACVRAAAAGHMHRMADDGRRRLFQRLADGRDRLLHLPAVIGCAEIFERQGDVAHRILPYHLRVRGGNRRALVGADAHIGPADCIVFTVIFGEFVTSHRADVGIGPYNSLSRYSTDSHRAFAFCVCLLQPFRGAFCYRPSCRRTIMTARRAAPER